MPNERAQVWRERSPTVGALGKRRGKVMAPDFLGSGVRALAAGSVSGSRRSGEEIS